MTVFIIIISIILWLASIWCLFGRQVIAPALSYVALLVLSFANNDIGSQLLPINNVMLIGWLCMTLVVMMTTMLQPEAIRRQIKGMAFLVVGGIVGLALGLLGFSVASSISMRYSVMILAVAGGIILGFVLYTLTPEGRPVGTGSKNFFKYLLAKGFPTAITLMQLGIALVLTIAMKNVNGL